LAYVEPFAGATHRLVRSKYVDQDDGLVDLELSVNELSAIQTLDLATNQRARTEQTFGMGIGPGELIYGVPNARLINAAFTHTSPYGNRFNDRTRGAWHAGENLFVAQNEVSYHQLRLHRETRYRGPWPVFIEYADLESDFNCDFHRLDPLEQEACLQSEPIPQSYESGQRLVRTLMFNERSNGIVYKSVRTQGGQLCVVCFRPVLVYPIRQSARQNFEMRDDNLWLWSESDTISVN
jgi:RES domain